MTAAIIPDCWTIPIELWPAATIMPSADGTWQPTAEQPGDEGIDASLLQIEERDGSLYDVVAWETMGDPEIWWLRWGRATFLGDWSIDMANREHKPIWLCATPRSYLQHVPLTCCILNWKADVRAILSQVECGIICTNPALWARARRAIDRLPSDRLNLSLVAA
jgi:hypothetical protein